MAIIKKARSLTKQGRALIFGKPGSGTTHAVVQYVLECWARGSNTEPPPTSEADVPKGKSNARKNVTPAAKPKVLVVSFGSAAMYGRFEACEDWDTLEISSVDYTAFRADVVNKLASKAEGWEYDVVILEKVNRLFSLIKEYDMPENMKLQQWAAIGSTLLGNLEGMARNAAIFVATTELLPRAGKKKKVVIEDKVIEVDDEDAPEGESRFTFNPNTMNSLYAFFTDKWYTYIDSDVDDDGRLTRREYRVQTDTASGLAFFPDAFVAPE